MSLNGVNSDHHSAINAGVILVQYLSINIDCVFCVCVVRVFLVTFAAGY